MQDDGSSIFTAEAKAIDLALDLVDNCNSCDKFIIFFLTHFQFYRPKIILRPKTHKSKTFCKNIIQFQNIKL